MAVIETKYVARKLDDRRLHAEADAEERETCLACRADRFDHAFDSAHTETAGDKQTVICAEDLARPLARGEQVTRQPRDIDADVVADAAVYERFVNALVAVDELRVLPHHGNANPVTWRDHAIDHRTPGREIRRLSLELETLHHPLVESLFVEADRDLIDRRHVATLDHGSELHVAEQRDLAFDILAQRTLRATDENIGLNSDLHELAHGVLGGLGLHLARGGDEWHERQVNEQRVLATDLV